MEFLLVGFNLLAIVFFCVVLVKATDFLVHNLRLLAKITGMSAGILAAFFLGLGTSLPELFVGITSALEGEPGLSLGNVLGSNIADIGLVMGLAALLGKGIKASKTILSREIGLGFALGFLPILLLWDKNLNRVDGLILVCSYLAYNFLILREQRAVEKENFLMRFYHHFFHKEQGKLLAKIFLGVAVLLFSADMIVRFSENLAAGMGMPLILVGLFLVAIGTSLPELAVEVEAARKKEDSVVFGNILGSIAANGSLVLGVTSLIMPIRVVYFEEFLTAGWFFAVFFVVFYGMVRTKKTLERWEGGVLILLYLLFLAWEMRIS